ncbi:MAG: hypothetical protein B7Z58_15525 [Acidiphilium sp. 37-64-53]|nr:MAG: hypothetical protein B7Z58_15525 [Acidiphilium sp. 37-64-53]OZB25647.1 MAG: hypothetical protein B7X49_13370 [Acidiphilium sp. 34-64-41]
MNHLARTAPATGNATENRVTRDFAGGCRLAIDLPASAVRRHAEPVSDREFGMVTRSSTRS